MIPVSIIDWWVAVWIDYSDRWAEVINITQEEFNKTQSWLAIFDVSTMEVTDVEQVVPPEPTPEEIREVIKNELVHIIIPKAVWLSKDYHPMVKGQIDTLRDTLYSEIKFRPTEDGEYIEVFNIVLKDVKNFMTLEWYNWYKQIGITFHEYIDDLFPSDDEWNSQ